MPIKFVEYEFWYCESRHFYVTRMSRFMEGILLIKKYPTDTSKLCNVANLIHSPSWGKFRGILLLSSVRHSTNPLLVILGIPNFGQTPILSEFIPAVRQAEFFDWNLYFICSKYYQCFNYKKCKRLNASIFSVGNEFFTLITSFLAEGSCKLRSWIGDP